MLTKLGKTELCLYFFLWISANLYSLYKLYEVQTELLEKYYSIEYKFKELQPGWKILSRLKDVSDFEWNTWKLFFSLSWHYLVMYYVISEFFRMYFIHFIKYWYLIGSIIFISTVFGVKQLFALSFQPIIFALICLSIGKKVYIWVTCILILITVNSLKYRIYFWAIFDHDNLQDEEIHLLVIGLGWMGLRCISFSIDYIDKQELEGKTKEETISKKLIDMFSYVFYLPTLYCGPIIMYEDFERGFLIKNDRITSKLRCFIMDIVLYLIYTLLLDLAFHYIYFLAMQGDIEVIRKLPSLALCGGGLWMGLQFHMKYVISYGTVGAFTRLDNIEPPPTPRCIARIHIYSQMWRYFDVGLYKFLIKYIYKPIIKIMSSKKELSKTEFKLFASLMTFVFIFIWHGTNLSIFVWSVLNYIGITFEQLGAMVTNTERYKRFKTNILKSDAMEARFKALVSAPLFAMSAISSFYLFGGYEIGNVFFEYFIHPSLWNAVIISLALYSCCHCSVALQNVPSRTDRS